MTNHRLPSWCDDARVFALPMTTRFRGITVREGMLLHGEAGWAEWSPFREYPAAEAATWLAAARESATMADLPALRSSIPVNATVPAVGPEQAYAMAAQSGCQTAKVKVAGPGSTLADDLARVEAVRAALGPAGHIRIDVNGGWSVDEALSALRQLSRFELEYVEQPTASVEELAELRRRLAHHGIDVLIAADESIRRADDPWRVKSLAAADIAVVKVQPLGGVRAAVRMAEELELPTVVSSALDSSIGLRMGLSLAAALPALPYACGLNTAALLQQDVVAEPLIACDGEIALPQRLAPTAAADYAADAETTSWWFTRLTEADAVLEQKGC